MIPKTIAQTKIANLYVKSKIAINLEDITPNVLKSLMNMATHRDPYYFNMRRRGYPTIGMLPRIKTYELTEDQIILWRGCLGNIIRVLKNAGIKPKIHDERLRLEQVEMNHGIELRDYQKQPVEIMIRRQQTIGRGPCGCHPAGTFIFKADGTTVAVENIKIGDKLLGPDGTIRIVLALHKPYGKTFRIDPKKGKSFYINEDHILTVQHCWNKKVEDIPFAEFKNKSKWYRTESRLVRANCIEFPVDKTDLKIDPYFLGVLLGDGCLTKGGVEVCNVDPPIIKMLKAQANKWNLDMVSYTYDAAHASTWGLSKKGKDKHNPAIPNPLIKELRKLGLMGKHSGEKFIPHIYKIASVSDRKKLLAGLLDTDGHPAKSGFDYISKSKRLAEDLTYVARSLGLAAYCSPCIKCCQNDFIGNYYRVSISGSGAEIPCRVEHKKASKRIKNKNVLHVGFTFKEMPVQQHYGFTLDGDGRYLLDDFTITHNSGKTEAFLYTIAHFKQPTLVLVWQERQQEVWVKRIRQWFNFEAGGIGGAFKTPSIKPITIGLVQSVRNKIDQYANKFGAVICDEVHRFSAKTFSDVINNMPAAIRLGASDDERRRDEREFLLYDTFGPLSWSLKKDLGQCEVKLYSLATPFQYGPYEFVPEHWTNVIEDITKHDARNKMVVDLAEQEARAGHRVLVWSDRVSHCKFLKQELEDRGITAGLLIGGTSNKEDANKTQQGLNDGSVSVGLGTAVAEQSINVPALDRGIMTCASGDPKLLRFKQMRGRLARPHPDKESKLYYLWDKKVPILYRRIYNIKRRYSIQEIRQVKKEKGSMSEKLAITLDSLKVGCKLLNIKPPRDATTADLKKLINRELSKNKTMGAYVCGACFSDIILGLSHCPFCGGQFVPTPEAIQEEDEQPEQETEEQEFEKADDEFEEGEQPEENDEQPEEEDEPEDEDEEEEEVKPKKKKVKIVEEAEDEEPEVDEDEDEDEDEEEPENDDEEEFDPDEEELDPEDPESMSLPADDEEELKDTDDENEDEEQDEEEPEDEPEDDEDDQPKPKKFSKAELSKRLSKTVSQDKREKAVDKLKEKEREQKREQIRSELPYNKVTLEHMKQTTLVMICAILGHKKPVQELKTPDKMIKYILKAQQNWKKVAPKPLLKKIKEEIKPAKATSKASIKSKSKR